MNNEIKTCQNCKKDFSIDPDDFAFYSKMQVPPPTFCPECRAQRRLVWRNERILYKRPCNAPGHSEIVVSNYGPHIKSPIYDQEFWWGDGWDPMSFGRGYDFSKPFFQQFKELLDVVPAPNIATLQCVNSDYCNFTYQTKNCYLSIASDWNEDSAYLYHTVHSKNSLDQLGCANQERCYESVHTRGCYHSAFLYFSSGCMDSSLLYNCHNCQNCFGCVNLRNGKYQIFNQQYSPEGYAEEIKKLNLGSYKNLQTALERFWKLTLRYPHRFANILRTADVRGDYISEAKHCYDCFDVEGPAENLRYAMYTVPNIKDVYDVYGSGGGQEQGYEITSAGGGAQNTVCSALVWSGINNYYSHFCNASSNIFGCVGLRNKKYCILNKEYSKEEYEALVPKIRAHMDAQPYIDARSRVYKFGEFFPIEIAPFAYNETIAYEYFPLTREEAAAAGYTWREQEKKSYGVTIDAADLPDDITSVGDEILKAVIGCADHSTCAEQCSGAFKIIPQELQYYREMHLPLPRLCSNCRHSRRLKIRNPFQLWHRKCHCAGSSSENGIYKNTGMHMHGAVPCSNEFETSYLSDRPEIVYCESCYQSEAA